MSYNPCKIIDMGSGTLNGTTNVTITNSLVLSTDKIQCMGKGVLTALSIGQITVISVSNGSFIVNSNIALDVRVFDYFIIRKD